jgi:hypothetical protein
MERIYFSEKRRYRKIMERIHFLEKGGIEHGSNNKL